MKSCNAISGEGNEISEKTTIGLISKKVLCSCSTLFCTFLCRCFARLQREHSRNFLATSFMKEMSYLLFTCFTAAHLGGRQHFHFLTAATKFSCCSSKKNVSFVFDPSLQLSVVLFLVELRWPVAYFLFFLSSSFSVTQICGHDK